MSVALSQAVLGPCAKIGVELSTMADKDAELKRAEEHKAKGNALFGQERFAEAAEEYSAAIHIVRSSAPHPARSPTAAETLHVCDRR
jgi:hypothetical protein